MLGAVLIAVLVWQRSNIMELLSLSKRGRKLTTTGPDAAGKIPLNPYAYRKEAEKTLGRAIEPEAFALALMLSSEGLSDNLVQRRARAWVAHNDLEALRAAFGWDTFTRMFTYSTISAQKGFFGRQEKGRRYDTSRPLYEGVLTDAEALLTEFEDETLDPTNGATKFVDLKALGVQPGTKGKTLASIEAEWKLKGRPLSGANSDFYVFGGKAA